MASVNFRKRLVKIVTFLAGVYFFLEFILPQAVLTKLSIDTHHEAITRGFIIVGTMALGLGIINLLMVHGSTIIFKRKGWVNSIALLVGLFIMMGVAVNDWLNNVSIHKEVDHISILADFSRRIRSDYESGNQNVPPYGVRKAALLNATKSVLQKTVSAETAGTGRIPPDHADARLFENYQTELTAKITTARKVLDQFSRVSTADPDFSLHQQLAVTLGAVSTLQGKLKRLAYKYTTTSYLWTFLFEGLFVALGSAMFSLLGIYIASAAYRAFRIRSFESTLMMAAALIVMLGQIPFGLWIYEEMPSLRLWLLEYPNSAAFRAIKIGAAVAGLVMAFRMWFSIESDYSEEAE